MLVALLLAATPVADAAVADRAGHRLEPLAVAESPGGTADSVGHGRACNANETWCIDLSEAPGTGQWRLLLIDVGAHPLPRRVDLPAAEGGWYTIWPHLVREARGALVFGVEAHRSTGYAGGGASANRLILYRAEFTGPGTELIELPAGGSATIRACFSDADRRARANACADRYEMGSELTLDPANDGERPRFLLTTTARTWPGHVTRDADSRDRGPLRRQDLTWWSDPVCSYRRTLSFDPATGRYVPDAPLPECADYLDTGD